MKEFQHGNLHLWKVRLQDSYSIIRHLLREKPRSLIELRKSIHRLQLRNSESNTSLVRLVTHVDREMNLMRYYGIWRYVFQGKNVTDSHSSARIPFMLTANQKQYLHQQLDYSLEKIKNMTPSEATRIIEYRIHSNQYQPHAKGDIKVVKSEVHR